MVGVIAEAANRNHDQKNEQRHGQLVGATNSEDRQKHSSRSEETPNNQRIARRLWNSAELLRRFQAGSPRVLLSAIREDDLRFAGRRTRVRLEKSAGFLGVIFFGDRR